MINNKFSRLPEDTKKNLCIKYKAGGITIAALAKQFSISMGLTRQILIEGKALKAHKKIKNVNTKIYKGPYGGILARLSLWDLAKIAYNNTVSKFTTKAK